MYRPPAGVPRAAASSGRRPSIGSSSLVALSTRRVVHTEAKQLVLNTERWARAPGLEPVFDPETNKEVQLGNTKESRARAAATQAVKGTLREKTCIEIAAAALVEAGGAADLFPAARALYATAQVLKDAAPAEKRDAHSAFRAAECLWRAALAVSNADCDAAVADARALVDAAEAVDAAAKAVAAVADLAPKIVARHELKDAECVWDALCLVQYARTPAAVAALAASKAVVDAEPAEKAAARAVRDTKSAPRPCPTSRTARRCPTTRLRIAGGAPPATPPAPLRHVRGLRGRRVRDLRVLFGYAEAGRPELAEATVRAAAVLNVKSARGEGAQAADRELQGHRHGRRPGPQIHRRRLGSGRPPRTGRGPLLLQNP